MSSQIRRVAFSTSLGVFLGITPDGKPDWSKSGRATAETTAPTFLNRKDFDSYVGDGLKDSIPDDVEMREIHPTGMDNRATVNDVGTALLPRWD